jgi:hypothetical protein
MERSIQIAYFRSNNTTTLIFIIAGQGRWSPSRCVPAGRRKHRCSARATRVGVQIFADVEVALHDRIECGLLVLVDFIAPFARQRFIGMDSWKSKSGQTVISAIGTQGNVATTDIHAVIGRSEMETIARREGNVGMAKRRSDQTHSIIDVHTPFSPIIAPFPH